MTMASNNNNNDTNMLLSPAPRTPDIRPSNHAMMMMSGNSSRGPRSGGYYESGGGGGSTSYHVKVVARVRPMSAEEQQRKGSVAHVYPAPENMDANINNNTEQQQQQQDTATTDDDAINNNTEQQQPQSLPGLLESIVSSDDTDDTAGAAGLTASAVLTDTPPSSSSQLQQEMDVYMGDDDDDALLSGLLSPPVGQTPTTTMTPVGVSAKKQQKPKTATIVADGTNGAQKRFVMDSVLAQATTQAQVYNQTIGIESIQKLLEGYSLTVLAYGQTGCGKTYTMSGPEQQQQQENEGDLPPVSSSSRRHVKSKSPPRSKSSGRKQQRTPTLGSFGSPGIRSHHGLKTDDGIIHRSLHDLFTATTKLTSEGAAVSIKLSCLEIYNDDLQDLLLEKDAASSPMPPSSADGATEALVLRDQGEAGVFIKGLTTVAVETPQDALQYLGFAMNQRTTVATCLNERSSRSHAIYTLHVTVQPPKVAGRSRSSDLVQAKLTMVDLAGSERIKNSGVVGLQQQESININKDLFVLGKVISALSDGITKKQHRGGGRHVHVPYRDSKLTRILRDSLGGNCCTVLIACVSPTKSDLEESINTLRYAERARSITCKPKPNIVSKSFMSPAQCVSLRAENKRLRSQILVLKKRLLAQDTSKPRMSSLPEDSDTTFGREHCNNRDADAADDMQLTGLQAKLKEVEKEARQVHTNADLWKDRCENMSLKSSKSLSERSEADANIPSILSYELCIDKHDNMSLADDDEDTFLSWNQSSTQFCADDTAGPLKAEIDDLTKEKDFLLEQIADLTRICDERQSQLDRLEENCKQQTSLPSPTSSEDTFHDADEGPSPPHQRTLPPDSNSIQLGCMEKKLDQERSMNNALAGELAQVQSKHNEVSEQLGEERCKNNVLTEQNQALIKDKENLESENCELTLKNLVYEDEVDTLQQDVVSKVSALRELEQNTNEQLETLRSDKENLEKEVTSLQSELATTKEEINQYQQQQKKSGAGLFPPDALTVEGMTANGGANAEQMLAWATEAIRSDWNRDGSLSSLDSSTGTEFLPSKSWGPSGNIGDFTAATAAPVPSTSQPHDASTEEQQQPQIVISNLHQVDQAPLCGCQDSSLFNGNAAHVEFYLPKISVSCACGKCNGGEERRDDVEEGNNIKDGEIVDSPSAAAAAAVVEDPTALENILREWQCDFLRSVGITTSHDFLRAYRRRRKNSKHELAKAMRRWRKQHPDGKKFVSVKTNSCGVALYIWYRTVKKVVTDTATAVIAASSATGENDNSNHNKSHRRQRPNFLDVTISSENRSVSTLGMPLMMDTIAE